jgi:uncharacterized membrane protein YdjX (TVP38/TMEM64 family)
MNPSIKAGFIILTSTLLAIFLIGLLRYYGLETHVYAMLEQIQKAGVTGEIVFSLVVASSVILLLPGIAFTLGAGFLFGVVHGSTLIVCAETVGATIAFLFARYAVGDSAAAYLQKRAKLMHVSTALLAHGWRLIAVLRMIPFFPFKLSNYVFGLVPVSFRDYVVGTFIGLWPITIFNVYLGSIAADLVSLGDAASPRSSFQWFMYAAGFSVSIAALLYLTRLSQRILAEYETEVDPP